MAIQNPALQLCKSCGEIPATGQARSREHCGPCYRHDVLKDVELTKCQVVGQFPIVDARTGEDVTAPGIVELDPAGTNIALLVGGGHVKIVKAEPAKKTEKA